MLQAGQPGLTNCRHIDMRHQYKHSTLALQQMRLMCKNLVHAHKLHTPLCMHLNTPVKASKR